jgi:hypothetical protein
MIASRTIAAQSVRIMSVDKYIHRENNGKQISSLAHFVPSSFALFIDYTVYGNDDKVPRYLY